MGKTETTINLEKEIYQATVKQGVFGCFEVTIGFGGKERVDYMTYDSKGIWRCYEIKTSKSDFHSKAKHTFVGHYNYYVMTEELYNEVKDEIPKNVGVYFGNYLKKKARKQSLIIEEQILKDSMIRSLYREYDKFLKTSDDKYINKLNNKIIRLQNEVRTKHSESLKYSHAIFEIGRKYNISRQDIKKIIDNLY